MQLNAGGRQVASDRGWSVVDFERLASWFADPKVCPHCTGLGPILVSGSERVLKVGGHRSERAAGPQTVTSAVQHKQGRPVRRPALPFGHQSAAGPARRDGSCQNVQTPQHLFEQQFDSSVCVCVQPLQMYLRSADHPDQSFLNSVLNIYLNLWHDHSGDRSDAAGKKAAI